MKADGNVMENVTKELEQINRYTRRPFAADEVYAFSVALCDNEVDRDYERFTPAALETLSGMYLGKTGIFDHSGKGSDQRARIFSARVETDPARTTTAGEPYARLVARAYLPRSQRNEEFILELESGIRKEVSVGCAVGSVTCSICGADLKKGACGHVKGREYEGKLCHAILDQPTDAYEWSFVAVPAQREAGVIKAFGGRSMEELKKAMGSCDGDQVVLSKSEAESLEKKLEELECLADCGRQYREQLCKNVVRLSGLVQPEVPADVMRRAAENMDLYDLRAIEKAFSQQMEKLLPSRPQLAAKRKELPETDNQTYKI